MQARLFAYRYPTTTLFVDDDRVFLQNLSVGLDDDLAAMIMDSPRRALDFITDHAGQPSLHETFLAAYRDFPDGIEPALTDRVVTVELSKIAEAVYQPDRFEEISVLVIDYAMPGLTGLEVCEQIDGLPIAKILLTGKADEKTAVEAFNRGIIDRFIVKSDPNALALVNQNIAVLQERHFEQASDTILRTLGNQAPRFMTDDKFAELFAEIRGRHAAVEYYLAPDAAGFLMFDADGRATLLKVLGETDLRGQWEIAGDQGAPADLVEALKSRKVVPHFWRSGGFYAPDMGDWRDFVHPAETFQGAEIYHYALLKDPPGVESGRVYAFEHYLEKLDASRDG